MDAAEVGAVAVGSAVDLAAAVDLVGSAAEISEAEVQVATGKTQQQVGESLSDLTGRLKTAFGDRLVSLILYGSASTADRLDPLSDLNVLCVLSQITTDELAKSEPVFHWWMERGNPSPLLLTADEVRTSADCFPMEYHDMQEQRRVLFGKDVIESLMIDNSAYRTQVEHELRSKQIRLRQKSAEVLGKADHLLKLLIHSISTFCVLGRHALILGGQNPQFDKAEIVTVLERLMNCRMDAFRGVLAVREAGKLSAGQTAKGLLEGYLVEIDALVRFVDGLSK